MNPLDSLRALILKAKAASDTHLDGLNTPIMNVHDVRERQRVAAELKILEGAVKLWAPLHGENVFSFTNATPRIAKFAAVKAWLKEFTVGGYHTEVFHTYDDWTMWVSFADPRDAMLFKLSHDDFTQLKGH